MIAPRSSACRAFWLVEAGRGEIREEPLPVPAAEEVLVETLFTGVSRGTESLVFRGSVPRSEWQRMRAPLQRGGFEFPVNYGYSNVGRVLEGPSELLGKIVFALAPHVTHFVAPGASVVVLPKGLPPGRAVLAANMETALNGVWDAQPSLGDRVSIVGAGCVGCLLAHLLSGQRWVDVQLIDVDARKASLAGKLGVSFALPKDAERERDIIINTSGAADGLRLALQLAANQATVLEMSWYGTEQVALPLGEAFHARRLKILSSQVGQVSANKRGGWTYRQRLELALKLLSDPIVDILITGDSSFETLPETMKQLVGSSGFEGAHLPEGEGPEPGPVVCHRIYYGA